jgi:hypothetical protein
MMGQSAVNMPGRVALQGIKAGPVLTLLWFGSVIAQQPPTWKLIEELRIGSVDDPAQALTEIRAVDVDARGNIYVTQPRDAVIRVFDATGKAVRTMGRRGQGPGEFTGISHIGFRGDTFFVSDFSQRRTSLFAANGAFIRSFGFGVVNVKPPLVPGPPSHLLPDGSLIATPGFSTGPSFDRTATELRRPTLRTERSGKIVDTLFYSHEIHTVLRLKWGDKSGSVTVQSLIDDPLVVIARDASTVFVVDRRSADRGRRAEFRITKLKLNGDTAWSRPYAYVARELTAADHDSIVRVRSQDFMRSRQMTEATAAEMFRKQAWIPAFWPPIAEAVGSSDGGLWLRQYEGTRTTTRWLVVDSAGKTKAAVNAPGQAKILQIIGDRVYARVRDEYDVSYVVRYRIQK